MKPGYQLEICVDTFASAKAALAGGASRIELCSALALGGLTPSIGLLQQIKLSFESAEIYCMLRPRSGDFIYDNDHLETITNDLLTLKEYGANGFVFGALDIDGNLDRQMCTKIISLADRLPVTLHRAFDYCTDYCATIDVAIDVGFKRILTSGQAATAIAGIDRLRLIDQHAAGRISIMAGSGINPISLTELLKSTNITEFHASASIIRQSSANNITSSFEMGTADTLHCWKETSQDVVREMCCLLS